MERRKERSRILTAVGEFYFRKIRRGGAEHDGKLKDNPKSER